MCGFTGRLVSTILKPRIDEAIAKNEASRQAFQATPSASPESTPTAMQTASNEVSPLVITKTTTKKRNRTSLTINSGLNTPDSGVGVNLPQ